MLRWLGNRRISNVRHSTMTLFDLEFTFTAPVDTSTTTLIGTGDAGLTNDTTIVCM